MKAYLQAAFALAVLLGTAPIAEAKLAELLVTDSDAIKTVELEAADVDVSVEQSSVVATYDLTFAGTHFSAQEGTFYFALPRDAYVHSFGMWVDGRYQGSAIVEAQAGRVAYESIVRRGMDPALLEWTAGNTFKMRVYPLREGTPARVRLAVGMPLTPSGGRLIGNLPLDLGKVAQLSIKVEGHAHAAALPLVQGLHGFALAKTDAVDGLIAFSGTYAAKHVLPPDCLRLSLDESDKTELKLRRADGSKERFFEARVFPQLPVAERPAPGAALVYWDYSLSEEDNLAARLDVLRRYLAERQPPLVDIRGFSQYVSPVAERLKGNDWGAIERAIRGRAYDGGTRLDLVARDMKSELARRAGKALDLLLFTNGVDSYELADFAGIKDLGAKDLQAFVIAPSIGANDAMIGRFGEALGATIIGEGDELGPGAFRSLPWKILSLKVSRNLADLELPPSLALPPNAGLVVRGRVVTDGKAELVLTMGQGRVTKTFDYRVSTDLEPESSDAVPRLWAARRINRLLADKRANAAEIKTLALTHQLLSPFTSMVVLEWCEDYAAYSLEPAKGCAKRVDTVADRVAEPDAWPAPEERDDDAGETFGGDATAADADSGLDAGAETADAATASMPSVADAAPQVADAPAAAPASRGAMADGGATAGAPAPQAMEYSEPKAAANTAAMPPPSDTYADAFGSPAAAPDLDTPPRPFGFEENLRAANRGTIATLYAEYVRVRRFYKTIPYYYVYSADLFAKKGRVDLATLVLSNIVEVRPGDARWLRVYAYSLVAWKQLHDVIPLYRTIAELRGEDPQSFRDYGLAMEAAGQPLEAMRLFAKVYEGQWDARLDGMRLVIVHDLGRAARAVLQAGVGTSEERAKAKEYCRVDESANDKIVITASWDTDNTDIDLHVVEPNGAHVYYNDKAPRSATGRLSHDATQGYGPEQYRNSAPRRGHYRVYLHYFAASQAVARDGTFVRVDFRIVQNGTERQFTKTVYLRDAKEAQTVLNFDYEDAAAPAASGARPTKRHRIRG